jgi:hypothetical protein
MMLDAALEAARPGAETMLPGLVALGALLSAGYVPGRSTFLAEG